MVPTDRHDPPKKKFSFFQENTQNMLEKVPVASPSSDVEMTYWATLDTWGTRQIDVAKQRDLLTKHSSILY